jgi:hypothetical protein
MERPTKTSPVNVAAAPADAVKKSSQPVVAYGCMSVPSASPPIL